MRELWEGAGEDVGPVMNTERRRKLLVSLIKSWTKNPNTNRDFLNVVQRRRESYSTHALWGVLVGDEM